MKPQAIFFSIKWAVAIKAAVLAFGLAMITYFYIAHYLSNQLLEANRQLSLRDEHQFEQLQSSHRDIQLGFIETLSLSTDNQSIPSLEELIATIDSNWASLTLLNGIDAMHIYDNQGQLLSQFGLPAFQANKDAILTVANQGEPQDRLHCQVTCQHHLIAPFLLQGNQQAIIAWGVSAAPLIQNFAALTETHASLITIGGNNSGKAGIFTHSHHDRQYYAELVNNYRQNKTNTDTTVIYRQQQSSLSLNSMPLSPETKLYLFWARDITKTISNNNQALRNALLVMLAAAFLILALIILSLRSLTLRSQRLAGILPLLTESEFDQAKNKLDKLIKKEIFHDEIDHLYTTSLQVTKQLKSLNERLHNLAYKDSLTNLPNRESLYQALDYHLRQLSRHQDYMGLLFIDVDNFKSINDTYGHKAGDFILVTLARNVSDTLRKADTLFRLAGDEFIVIVTDLKDQKGLEITANKVKQAMEKTFIYEDQPLSITLSIGGVMSKQANINPDHLLHRADEAMYVSKQAGKGQYSFYGEI